MNKKEIATGVIHKMPADLRKTLTSAPAAQATWEDITPLARNEWICWVISAKKPETRARRIRITRENMNAGKRRTCCWAGCSQRNEWKMVFHFPRGSKACLGESSMCQPFLFP